jgi:putative transposase
VISLDVTTMSESALQQGVIELRARNAKLIALLRLVVVLLRVCDVTLARRRISDGNKKRRILWSVERSRATVPLRTALRLLGLSASRYHSWRRDEECTLDDVSSCPQSRPSQLTTEERAAIKEMVCSKEYRHVPTGRLAIFAQRLGKVFASPSTWHRLVRKHRWRRPRKRVHPPKPCVGIRASRPDEIWHIDTTIVRLLDGTHAYLYAVIDNFSRRILAWRVSERFDPTMTLEVLIEAGEPKNNPKQTPTLLADAGVENRTAAVDELIDSGALRRVIAQTEIAFSNSLIEAWWRTLKHQWLYLNTLDTVESLRRLVEFYVGEHNTRLPHSAFKGQTPDEMYRGEGKYVPEQLVEKRKTARAERLKTNRSVSCGVCEAEATT